MRDSVIFSALALGFSLTSEVAADIPVHCLRHQVEGEWEFTLGPASAERSSCGHEHPDNQNREPPAEMVTGPTTTMKVTLEDANRARTDTDQMGTFTMIYDEGFEVNVDGRSFFAFSRFDLDDQGRNVTNCDETLTGWYHDADGGNYGCYYGKKSTESVLASAVVDSPTSSSLFSSSSSSSDDGFASSTDSSSGSDSSTDAVLSELAHERTEYTPYVEEPLSQEFHQRMVDRINARDESLWNSAGTLLQRELKTQRSKSWTARVYDNMVGKTRTEINKMAGLKRNLSLKEAKKNHHRANGQISSATKHQFLDTINATSFLAVRTQQHAKLPASLDWESEGVLDPTVNQGDCGSCYTVATTRMLSARRRIKEGNHGAPPFSISFPLHCSEYNQGCEGGYAFLQSKWSEDVGMIPAKCFTYDASGSCSQAISLDCVRSETMYRAKNHRYVGGYYGGSDEEEIMEELARNGPLVVSFEPKDDFMYYKDGIYTSSVGDEIHQEWERVDHAVLLIGYGEDAGGKKFWKVQNSWGPDWGERGFFRIARGDNDSGVESIAVAADVQETSGSTIESFLQNRMGGSGSA